MPAIYTHVCFGEEVLKILPDPLVALAEKHKEIRNATRRLCRVSRSSFPIRASFSYFKMFKE